MALSLKPERLKRYKDVVVVHDNCGRGELVEQSSHTIVGKGRQRALATESSPKAEELADDLEKLGSTFIKLGQLLSTRPDIMPEPYLDALSRLQDDVEP